jgi:hypothetical protein
MQHTATIDPTTAAMMVVLSEVLEELSDAAGVDDTGTGVAVEAGVGEEVGVGWDVGRAVGVGTGVGVVVGARDGEGAGVGGGVGAGVGDLSVEGEKGVKMARKKKFSNTYSESRCKFFHLSASALCN